MANFNYSLWDEDDELPVRSRLYCLPMESGDGCRQEALLDYFQRLALAHRVSVFKLLKEEIIPLTQIKGALYSSRFAAEYSRTFNSHGKYAEQVADTLQNLTRQTTLANGTFLHWRPMLDKKGSGLLYPGRRWCPSCLAEAQNAGSSITHALIWAVSIVTHCPIHLSPLRQCCEACGAKQPFISDHLPLGRCASCGSFLGALEGLWSIDPPSARQSFFLNSVAEMIALGERAKELAQPEVLARRLKEVVDSNFDGKIGYLEKETGFRKYAVAKWAGMKSCPQFDLLLELCYRITVSPVDLLSGKFAESGRACIVHKIETPIATPRDKPTAVQIAAIKKEIQEIVSCESSYVTAKSFANKYGFTARYFKYWFPSQNQELTTHRRRVQNLLSRDRTERLMEQARDAVQELYSVSPRISRRRICNSLDAIGICMKNPAVRVAALDERKRLQSQLIVRWPGQIDDRGFRASELAAGN